MSTGAPNCHPQQLKSIQRTIDALASRNVEAFIVESKRSRPRQDSKELVPEGSEVFRQHLGDAGYHRLQRIHAR